MRVYEETRATTVPSFPKLLWEAVIRMGGIERPEYIVFQDTPTATRQEYWAKVAVFNVQGSGSQHLMFTGLSSRSPYQAIQLAAYAALTQMRHELDDMKRLRATKFFPRHAIRQAYREYATTSAENDPALVQMMSFIEA